VERIMPRISLKRLSPERAEVYHRLRAALFRVRDWIAEHTLDQAHADASQGAGAERPELLRALAGPLSDAEATETLSAWRSGKGLRSWQSTMYGQAMRWIVEAAGELMRAERADPTQAREHKATLAQRLAMNLRSGLSSASGPEGDWADFQAGVAEYADEVLGLLSPSGTEAEDRFDDFNPKPRKLLLALSGKGKVPLLDAFRAVQGRKAFTPTSRGTFLTLVRRTSDELPTKGRNLAIDKTGDTLELVARRWNWSPPATSRRPGVRQR
jgi:hypothetical protein